MLEAYEGSNSAPAETITHAVVRNCTTLKEMDIIAVIDQVE